MTLVDVRRCSARYAPLRHPYADGRGVGVRVRVRAAANGPDKHWSGATPTRLSPAEDELMIRRQRRCPASRLSDARLTLSVVCLLALFCRLPAVSPVSGRFRRFRVNPRYPQPTRDWCAVRLRSAGVTGAEFAGRAA